MASKKIICDNCGSEMDSESKSCRSCYLNSAKKYGSNGWIKKGNSLYLQTPCIDCGKKRMVRSQYAKTRVRCYSCANKAKPPQIKTTNQVYKRFWSKVLLTANDDLCWNWAAGKSTRGYGSFKLDNSTDKAHRVSYRLTYGDFDNSLQCLHKCDNPSCVNPKHLFLGNSLDNNQDRDIKGRNGSTKLSKEQVIEIRKKHSKKDVTNIDLAKQYNISDGMISLIVNRKSWRHL